MLQRRTFLTAGASLLLGSQAMAQTSPAEVLLWPQGAPGADKVKAQQEIGRSASGSLFVTGVTRPSIAIYKPSGPFTKAVMIVPGGGFRQVVTGKEGHDIAKWLVQNGVAAGVLTYRLTADQWPQGPQIMLEDSQRALRLLRQETGAAKVGVLGFSAGGLIAAILDSRANEKAYPAYDPADALSAKPDFVGLGYAVLNAKRPRIDNGLRKFAKNPAPTFLFHAMDDARVGVENSRYAYREITKAGGKAEMHLFRTGDHGFALTSRPGSPSAAWPTLFLDWLQRL